MPMKADEPLKVAVRTALTNFVQRRVDLRKKGTVTAIAKAAWKRHREATKQGHCKVTSKRWHQVSPGWQGRYRKIAQDIIDEYIASTAST